MALECVGGHRYSCGIVRATAVGTTSWTFNETLKPWKIEILPVDAVGNVLGGEDTEVDAAVRGRQPTCRL